jgi:hypothetical protein
VAASLGKAVRDVRQAVDTAMNPVDVDVPDDFNSYYYESLEHAGEEVPVVETEEYEAAYPEDLPGYGEAAYAEDFPGYSEAEPLDLEDPASDVVAAHEQPAANFARLHGAAPAETEQDTTA